MAQEQVLALLKKKIGFTLQALKHQLQDVHRHIEKKETSISTLRMYLKEYQPNYQGGVPQAIHQVINQQSFLDRIASALVQEQEQLDVLMAKKQLLAQDIQEQTHQIDTIDEALCHAQTTRRSEAELRMEHMNQEQWAQFTHHQQKSAKDTSWNK